MKILLSKLFITFGVFVLATILTASATFAATYIVDSAVHPSPGGGACDPLAVEDCSLQEAVNLANSTPDVDTIEFALSGVSIEITRDIVINEPLIIDGYARTDLSKPNSVPAPGLTDAVIPVAINGSMLPSGSCITIDTNDPDDQVIIRGIAVNECPGDGIQIYGNNKIVQGSYIGTDLSGTVAMPNSRAGIRIENGENHLIGGADVADRNVISGNANNGIHFTEDVNSSRIEGNFIGLDSTGTVALGNGFNGVHMGPDQWPYPITRFSGNIVGNGPSDSGDAKRNFISGNSVDGVRVIKSDDINGEVQIDNNYIGTDVTGTEAVPNVGSGIYLNSVYDVLIQNNLVSANLKAGIYARGLNVSYGSYTYRVFVLNNYIGTDFSGVNPLGNGGSGVIFDSGTNRSAVGDASIPDSGNIIAYNGGNGVVIDELETTFGSRGNKIQTNSIFENGGLGIDLGDDGVSRNDKFDGDEGPNNLQNYPIIDSAVYSGVNTTISGSLHSVPFRDGYRVEIFANDEPDPTDYGEGQIYLGAVTGITLNDRGNASFSFDVPGDYSDKYITATATDKSMHTSEFGRMNTVDLSIEKTATSAEKEGDEVTFSITVLNPGGLSEATDIRVKDVLSGFSFVSYSASQGTYDESTGIWELGNLLPGDTADLTIRATVTSCGTLTNTASISHIGQYDTNLDNNTASVTFSDITCRPVAGGRPTHHVQQIIEQPAEEPPVEVEEDKYCDYTFQPADTDKVTRAEFVRLMLEFNCYEITQEMPVGEKTFDDYPRENYDDPALHNAIANMYLAVDEGIISGYPDNTLRPFEPVLYAEAAKIVHNATGQTEFHYSQLISVMPKNLRGAEWFVKYFLFLIELTGNSQLMPGDFVSAEDAEIIIGFILKNI